MGIHLQESASIQQRTCPVKFARSPCTDPSDNGPDPVLLLVVVGHRAPANRSNGAFQGECSWTLDRTDPKSGIASPNYAANLSGLVLGSIEADLANK